ncbi:hypothetical protein [Thauera humireducens]|uniref:hypothetical protein n=1 Tax=Thauera humireducens TaxID=1134435 RepID=UPI00311E9A30
MLVGHRARPHRFGAERREGACQARGEGLGGIAAGCAARRAQPAVRGLEHDLLDAAIGTGHGHHAGRRAPQRLRQTDLQPELRTRVAPGPHGRRRGVQGCREACGVMQVAAQRYRTDAVGGELHGLTLTGRMRCALRRGQRSERCRQQQCEQRAPEPHRLSRP